MARMTPEMITPITIAHKGLLHLTAQVTPGLGANLVSLKVDGAEMLAWDPKALLAGTSFTGAFTMFPTPCRLDRCSYEFEGRRVVQKKHGEEVFIHGLVRDEALAWKVEGAKITSTLEIAEGHPVFEGFPFPCTFSVTHALNPDGLTVSFSVRNTGKTNLPCGYGIHPYWRIHGSRRDVLVRIPCDRILELKDLVPTGAASPVAGTPLDLRALRSIEELYIDNAFWPRKPGDTAEVVFRALGKRMLIEASDNFPHMIVYAPKGEAFICVENLTTCPNAPNLASAGHGDVASMLVVAPGKTAGGWIRYTFENIK